MVPLAIGSLLGLLALTKPEPAIAGFIGVATWLALRRRTGIASRGEIMRVAGPAVLIPGLVYGSFMAIVTPDRLLFENLYPREFLAENPLVTVRLPPRRAQLYPARRETRPLRARCCCDSRGGDPPDTPGPDPAGSRRRARSGPLLSQ